MSEVMKVLLTGSADNIQCAAKAVCTSLQSMSINALSINGVSLIESKNLKDKFLQQIKDEDINLRFLKNSDSDKSVLIVCGGLLDIKYKLSDTEFSEILTASGESEDKIRNSHLLTIAVILTILCFRYGQARNICVLLTFHILLNAYCAK